MNAQNPPKQPQNDAKPARISARIRNAIRYRVYKGMTWDEAARAAGCSVSGIHAARHRPEVQALHTSMMLDHIAEAKNAQALIDKLALDTIAAALASDVDWSEKRKWVELLRREPKSGPQINVQNNVQNLPPQGYAYAPPGSRVVKIDPPSDSGKAQAIDNAQEMPLIGSRGVISGEIASPKDGGSHDE